MTILADIFAPSPSALRAMAELGIREFPLPSLEPTHIGPTLADLGMFTTKDRAGFDRILARILDGIDTLSDGINAGAIGVDAWQREMAQLLLVGHVAAYQEGRGRDELTPGARRVVAAIMRDQVDFLNRFADQVEAQGWNDARDRSRAALYAGSLKQTFSRGETFGLALPFYPGDGSSECLGNCGCRWRVEWLDDEELDADCFWMLGGKERHCTTCPTRAADNPYRVRGGALV